MTEHNTYFRPEVVVHTELDTGKKTIEIDFGASIDRENDWYKNEPDKSEEDVTYLDDILFSVNGGYFEMVSEGIIRIHTLDIELDS